MNTVSRSFKVGGVAACRASWSAVLGEPDHDVGALGFALRQGDLVVVMAQNVVAHHILHLFLLERPG